VKNRSKTLEEKRGGKLEGEPLKKKLRRATVSGGDEIIKVSKAGAFKSEKRRREKGWEALKEL